jgi:hypothetical protein
MKDYIIFFAKELNRFIDEKSDKIHIGWKEHNNSDDMLIDMYLNKSNILTYIDLLEEFAIEEEYYEFCDEIIELKEKTKKYLS